VSNSDRIQSSAMWLQSSLLAVRIASLNVSALKASECLAMYNSRTFEIYITFEADNCNILYSYNILSRNEKGFDVRLYFIFCQR
jgi:hypothetical protein